MHGSLLHSLLAICAAGALLLQHAPITPAGHSEHEHCIHCTDTYCTKDGCTCAHKSYASRSHAHDTDAMHGDGNATRSPYTSDRAIEHSSKAGHDLHRAGGDELDAVHHAPSSRPSDLGLSIEPCDSSPTGIITFMLDKYVVLSSVRAASYAEPIISSARYVSIADQLLTNLIFRPPDLTGLRFG